MDGVIEEWEEINGCIWGYIYNDIKGRFPDGHLMKTSIVVSPNLSKLGSYMVINTRNSKYFIGAKAGEYNDD